LTCELDFEDAKTYRVRSEFRDHLDNVGAVVESLCGLLDLFTRRLHPDPAAKWRERAERPEVLSL
jgi:hypothetical protein